MSTDTGNDQSPENKDEKLENEPQQSPEQEQGNDESNDLQKELNKLRMENNMLKNKQNSSGESDEMVRYLAWKDAANDFLSSNKQQYPDVELSDLESASSPEELKTIAEKTQDRINAAAQRRIQEEQKATAPEITPEQRESQLKEAKKKGDFDKFLKLNMPKNWF